MKRRIIVALLAGLVVGVAAVTQEAEPQHDEDREEWREELVAALAEARKRLALTDEQAEQVRPILLDDLTARVAVLTEHGIGLGAEERPRLNLRELRALNLALAAVRAEPLEALAEVLNAEQLAVYQEFQAEAADALRERVRERRTGEA